MRFSSRQVIHPLCLCLLGTRHNQPRCAVHHEPTATSSLHCTSAPTARCLLLLLLPLLLFGAACTPAACAAAVGLECHTDAGALLGPQLLSNTSQAECGVVEREGEIRLARENIAKRDRGGALQMRRVPKGRGTVASVLGVTPPSRCAARKLWHTRHVGRCTTRPGVPPHILAGLAGHWLAHAPPRRRWGLAAWEARSGH